MHLMKKLVVILLIGAFAGQSLGLVAQSIPTGDFFAKKSNELFESELFQFNSDKTFNCVVFGDNYKLLGQGRYAVKNDTLILHFESHPMQRQSERVEFSEGPGDKTTINLKVKVARSESAFQGANCFLRGLQRGTTTDSTGQARLVIDKLSKADTLEVYFIGYNLVRIPIQPNYDTINVWANLDNLSFYTDGDKARFKVNWIKRSSFGLQRLDNLELTYQKISAKKKMELTKWIK